LWIPSIDPTGGDNVSGTHDHERYAIWEKIAQGISNLEALREIQILHFEFEHLGDDEREVFVPDWEILACILRRLRIGINLLCMHDIEPLPWDTGALQVFAGVIHGHPMITGFSTGACFPIDCLDIVS
jgi:hypothetical protein